MPIPQRIVQVCLLVIAAIAIPGGLFHIWAGQPDATPRVDQLHRFLAGGYCGIGVIALWAAITVRQQGALIHVIAVVVALAALGRLVSIARVGMPEPAIEFIGALAVEIALVILLVAGQRAAERA